MYSLQDGSIDDNSHRVLHCTANQGWREQYNAPNDYSDWDKWIELGPEAWADLRFNEFP
jgi:hypothetical protein